MSQLPQRDEAKPAEQQGLFQKFIVARTDGNYAPGQTHCGCEYFVLDVQHDHHAKAALAAYATACAATHPQLSADMRTRYALPPPEVKQEPVAWFHQVSPQNEKPEYQQVAKEFYGKNGTAPLFKKPFYGFGDCVGVVELRVTPTIGTIQYIPRIYGNVKDGDLLYTIPPDAEALHKENAELREVLELAKNALEYNWHTYTQAGSATDYEVIERCADVLKGGEA